MTTLAQIVANRANALLSTGPTTPDGIAACKFNATKHSLTGKQIVVKGEDPAAYEAIRTDLLASLTPANEHEAMLVEEIAQNWWRHERALRVEAQVLEKFDPFQCVTDPEARKSFALITRYVNSTRRSLDRARREIEKLQKARKKDETAAPGPTVRNNNSGFAIKPPLSLAKIGSVSQPQKTRHPNEDLPWPAASEKQKINRAAPIRTENQRKTASPVRPNKATRPEVRVKVRNLTTDN